LALSARQRRTSKRRSPRKSLTCDDTRAFLSIPARHDTARRIDCAFLARLVSEHRLAEDDAADVVVDLAYRLVKKAYRL